MDCANTAIPNTTRRLLKVMRVASLVGVMCAGSHVPAAFADPSSPVDAAQSSETALLAHQAQLLDAMLSNPADVDIALDYATVSTQIGDYEAAIGTLERLLIFAPGDARLRLELGVLYFRLGSYDVARGHFESLTQDPNVPADVAERASVFLAAVDKEERPTAFEAVLMTGLRYQSNANAGPGSRQVTLNGTTFVLDDTSIGKEDWNAFIAGNAHVSYDLGTQGDLLEADFLFYAGRYFDATELNTGIAELTFGPSFNMGRFDIDNARLGVYGIVSGVRLNDANYSGTLGAGARLGIQPSVRSSVDAKVEYRQRWFRDTGTYPTVSDRDGYQVLARIAQSFQVNRDWTVRAVALGDYEQASANFEQSWEGGGGLGVTYRFASPFEALERAWEVDADIGYIRREYDAPDPSVSPTLAQADNEFWVRGGLAVPLHEDLSAAITAEFRRLQSNYVTRDYSNASVTFTVIRAF